MMDFMFTITMATSSTCNNQQCFTKDSQQRFINTQNHILNTRLLRVTICYYNVKQTVRFTLALLSKAIVYKVAINGH